jgi:predicted metal-dependent phosphoesterase TrpH
MFADLHIHSSFSDGTDTPFELCTLALDSGLQVISITDHDTISGYKALQNGQMPKNLDVIPGVEISIEVKNKMIHVLGYFIDIWNNRLEDFINRLSHEKTVTTKLNFDRACESSIFSYAWERVLALNPGQPRISGVHVVKAMSLDGYEVPGMGLWDMFHRYFWPENDNYVSIQTLTAYDAIDVIKHVGGVPVIAHPKSINDDGIIFDLVNHGIQGLEVYHPVHKSEDEVKYLEMAKSKHLYISGGTDWHGSNNGAEVTGFAMKGLSHENYDLLKLRNSR